MNNFKWTKRIQNKWGKSLGRLLCILAGTVFFVGASSHDVELEKTSQEQKEQITTLEQAIESSKVRFKISLAEISLQRKQSKMAVNEEQAELKELKDEVEQLKTAIEDYKSNPPPRYDQMFFANGAEFVGQAVRYQDDKITIRSSTGEEKTGPIAIMTAISFHLQGLEIEPFPEPPARDAPKHTTTHAQVMARFNPNLVFLVVSRGGKNYDDGITRKGNTTYYSSAEEDVQLKVKVGYKNPQAKLEGCSLQVFALGRDLGNKKQGKVLIKQKFKLGAIGPEGETVETAVKHIRYQKSKYFSKKSGIDYYSYLAVIKNKDGEVIHMKGSRSSVEAMYEKLSRLSSGDSFTY